MTIYNYNNRNIMFKILKITPLLAAMLILTPTFGEYRVNIPLENTQGGLLPNGSISFGDKDSTGNEGETPSSNCSYSDEGTMVTFFKQDTGPFKAGDKGFVYQGNIIGYYSPSNGYPSVPAGLSAGKLQDRDSTVDNYEICVDDPNSYPSLPNIGGGPPPNDP